MDKHVLDDLYKLTKSEYRPSLEKFLQLRIKNVEDTLYSLKIDKYKANWSTVMIKMREAFQSVLSLPELVDSEITEEKMKKDYDKEIDDLIEQLSM